MVVRRRATLALRMGVTIGGLCIAGWLAPDSRAITGAALPGGSWHAVGMLPTDANGNAGANITVDSAGYIYANRRYTNGKPGETYRSTTPGGGVFTAIGNGAYPAALSPNKIFATPLGVVSGTDALYYLDTASNSWKSSALTGSSYTVQGVNGFTLDDANHILVSEVYTPKVAISSDGGKSYNVTDLTPSLTTYVNQTYPSGSGYSYSATAGAITGIAALKNGAYLIGGEFGAKYTSLPNPNPNTPTDYTHSASFTGLAANYAALVAGTVDWSTNDSMKNTSPSDNTTAKPADAGNSQIYGFTHAGDKWGTSRTRSGQTLWSMANYGSPIQVLDDAGVPHYAAGLTGTPGRTQLDTTHDFVNYTGTEYATIGVMPLTDYGYNFFQTRGGVYATDGIADGSGKINWFRVQTTGLPAALAASADWASGTDDSAKVFNDSIATYGGSTYIVAQDGEVYQFTLPEPGSMTLLLGAGAILLRRRRILPAHSQAS